MADHLHDASIIRFCSALAGVRKMYRAAHIAVEKKPFVKEVTTTVSFSEGIYNEDAMKGRPGALDSEGDYGISVSMSLDAELVEMLDNDRYSLGASLAVRSLGDHWLVQSEIGWSCRSGWDEKKDYEMDCANADELVARLGQFCDELLADYHVFVNEHETGGAT